VLIQIRSELFLERCDLPDRVFEHLLTMARLHAANRYDRLTHDVEAITGRPATSTRDFVARHAESFRSNEMHTKVSGQLEAIFASVPRRQQSNF
jgi:hypothetical protein